MNSKNIQTMFRLAVFLSGFLLFQFELMTAQKLLPTFGGNFQVWSTCLVFFNFSMLLGYGFVDVIIKKIPSRFYSKIHLLLYFLSLFFLYQNVPLTVEKNTITSSIFRYLTSQIGLPFLLLTTTLPLLQLWYGRLKLTNAYQLYSYSGVGSVLGLISFPFVFNVFMTVSLHQQLLSCLFIVLLVLFGILAIHLHVNNTTENNTPQVDTQSNYFWIFGSFLSCLFMLAITNSVSRFLGSVPITWMIPLVIYIFSFILIFKPWYSAKIFNRLLICWIILFLASFILSKFFLIMSLYLFLFLVCILINRALYISRPNHDSPKFNFYLNIGGLIATLLVTFIIPLFKSKPRNFHIEFYLSIFFLAIFFAIRDFDKENFNFKHKSFYKTISMIIVALIIPFILNDNSIKTVAFLRNAYSVLEVSDEKNARFLTNGSVTHGAQLYTESGRHVPSLYYTQEGPFADIIKIHPNNKSTAVIGLGTGAMAYYAQAAESWIFIELDPNMEVVAKKYFSFLKESQGNIQIINGDGRIMINNIPEKFDLIVIDAFSGDAVPAHLLTEEAIKLYLSKLTDDNAAIVFHVSNLFVDLESVIYPSARKLGLHYAAISRKSKDKSQKNLSRWCILTKNAQDIDTLAKKYSWKTKINSHFIQGWTDDHVNFLYPITNQAIKYFTAI
jgi:hypothetical protein